MVGEISAPGRFVTAYDAYAMRAFEVNAVDYLLKPFDPDRFAGALARAEARLAGGSRATLAPELKALIALNDSSRTAMANTASPCGTGRA